MKTIDISKRLETLTKYVSPYQYVVDVGTDHCFVPIYLKQKGLISQAIASDIHQGPIMEAIKNIEKYGYSGSIETRIGPGLVPILERDRVDVIIVAGMGGKLISEILASNLPALKRNKRLILQANVASPYLRTWLKDHDYQIIAEEIIQDHSIYYEIIVAEQGSACYSADEIVFGPFLLETKSELFCQKWQDVLVFKSRIFNQIPDDHEQKLILQAEIKQIEVMLGIKK
jgi:tRNA (adenine22-N1)-methyltransferase